MLKNEKNTRLPAKWKLNRDYRRYKHSLTRTETFLNRHMSLHPNNQNKERLKRGSPKSRGGRSSVKRFETKKGHKGSERKTSSRNIRRLLSLNKGLVEKSEKNPLESRPRECLKERDRTRGSRSKNSAKGGRARRRSSKRGEGEREDKTKLTNEENRARKSGKKRRMEINREKTESRRSNRRRLRSNYDVDNKLPYFMTRKLGKGSYATVYLGTS